MPAIINSDDGVVSGSAGLKTSGANDGILAFQNNGTTNVTVTAAGNVGIGTSSPNRRLEVAESASGKAGLRVNNSSTANGAGVETVIELYNTVSNNMASLSSFRDTNEFRLNCVVNGPMSFYTNNIERAKITSGGDFQFNSGYGSVATAYGCRAWVNFNGTGTVAIRASGNVTSITDNGTGDYTVNFTTAMPDANYSVIGTCNINLTGNYNRVVSAPAFAAPTTSALRFATSPASTGNAEDQLYVFIAIFR